MRSSSIRKFFILRKVQRCSITSSMKSVDVPEHGRWTHLLKTASKRSARKLEMEKFSARYPVELTLLLQPLCSQRQSATSSPVYSLITVFSVRMKATRSEVFGPNGPYDLHFIRVNAQQRFYDKLAGVEEPERKRKIIGEEFIRVFEEEAKKIGAVDFLVQGTIYPDVVESGLGGESAVIKSHHNVGGLPDYVDFKEIIEPLRDLFKDEVRKAGLELGIPEKLVYRQPFPGPGLGIRIIGAVTPEKVKMVQEADAIYREEIAKAGIDRNIGQYFAALTNMRSVGVMGDERTYDYAIALRAVNTIDFMTAEAAEIRGKFSESLPAVS